MLFFITIFVNKFKLFSKIKRVCTIIYNQVQSAGLHFLRWAQDTRTHQP